MPPADAPEGVVAVTPPDADGELAVPDAGELTVFPEGELVLRPVPLELVVPVLAAPDGAVPLTDVPAPDGVVLLTEPDVPAPDVGGDAAGD